MASFRHYEIGEPIATGGMGEVYAGYALGEHGFRRAVAFKRLRDELCGDERATERFIREANLCGSFDHPNVIAVLDLHRSPEGRLFLVMERVDGLDLATLAELRRLPESVCVTIIRAVLRGLAYVHARGIVHRDMSPHNVLLSCEGAVKVADFGLAKLADTPRSDAHTLKGKVRYMAPEQAQGEKVDARSDLFATGVMLYELLTGELPFCSPDATVGEAVAQILMHSPKQPRALRPDITAEVAAVTLRLLARDPAERYPSADAALADLPALDDATALSALMYEVMGKEGDAMPGASSAPTVRRPAALDAAHAPRATELPAPPAAEPSAVSQVPALAHKRREIAAEPGPWRRRRHAWHVAAAVGGLMVVGVLVTAGLRESSPVAPAHERVEAPISPGQRGTPSPGPSIPSSPEPVTGDSRDALVTSPGKASMRFKMRHPGESR